MALTVISSGTTTTDGTEQSLVTDTTSRVYVFAIDANAMVNGDVIEVRIKTKVLSGGTSRIAYLATYAHIQSAPAKYSVPVPADIECVVTLKRVAGSDHAYPWKLIGL